MAEQAIATLVLVDGMSSIQLHTDRGQLQGVEIVTVLRALCKGHLALRRTEETRRMEAKGPHGLIPLGDLLVSESFDVVLPGGAP